ncbi:MAG: creatininase family protein [Clostridiales bacterium]|nr:creatininase family protein [Clostridiales bacterium]
MSIFFGDHSWPQLEELLKKDPLAVIPVGMFEQHGTHLPVSTDTDLAWSICETACERISGEIPVLLLPSVWTGYHGKTVAKWPGSISLRPETLKHLVYDIAAALVGQGVRKIVIANGHGQNPAILEIVCRKIADDFDVVPLYAMPVFMLGKEGAKVRTSAPGGMGGHADELETSLMLKIRPELVDMSKAPCDPQDYRSKFVAGDLYPEQDMVRGVYWSSFHIQSTESGAQGDATVATAEKGDAFFDIIIDNFCELLREYYFFERRP